MSEQGKHTPGPWRVAPPYLYGTGDGIHVDAGARSYIAHVGERGDAQSEADARLIAAAPDGYAFADAFLEWTNLLRTVAPDCLQVPGLKALEDKAAAFIDKAEGRA